MRFIVYAGPPSIEDLYADWSAARVELARVEISDVGSQNGEGDSEDSQTSSNMSLLPPAAVANASNTIYQESYADGSISDQSLPSFRFEVERLTVITDCVQEYMREQQLIRRQVVALVTKISPLETKMRSNSKSSIHYLSFDIADDSGKKGAMGKLTVVCWGEAAKEMARALRVYDVVYFRGVFR